MKKKINTEGITTEMVDAFAELLKDKNYSNLFTEYFFYMGSGQKTKAAAVKRKMAKMEKNFCN